MNVYYRSDAASAIRSEGFLDTTYIDVTGDERAGVCVSLDPPDPDEGAKGTLLTLQIPGVVFTEFECVDECGTCRRSVVPSEILNRYGPPALVTDEDSFSPRFDGSLVLPEFEDDVVLPDMGVDRGRSQAANAAT